MSVSRFALGDPAPTAVAGVVAAVFTASVIGVPTDVVPNPWFSRVVGVRPIDVVVLVALSLLTGALVATYVVAGRSGAGAPRAGIGSGVLGWFAVGCPVCNKLVVLLLGASGATRVFEPVQPVLGVAAVILAMAALNRARARDSSRRLPGSFGSIGGTRGPSRNRPRLTSPSQPSCSPLSSNVPPRPAYRWPCASASTAARSWPE